MTVRYLADTSAVYRIYGRMAAARWQEATEAGMVAFCDPVELELLQSSPATRRAATRRVLHGSFPWVPVPDSAWGRALETQDWLAETNQHSGASVFDLIIAATAEHHHLTVLHDDRDYEVISRVTGLPTQRVID